MFFRRIVILISILAVSMLILSASFMSAQENKNPRLCYNLGFQSYFDNSEFASSPYDKSGTLFGARINPEIGFIRSVNGAEHKLILGANFQKNFGDIVGINKDFLKEFFFFYQTSVPVADDDIFRLYAGVIPSEYRLEEWNTLFYSEKRSWQDPYTEGLMLQYTGEGKGVELSCDWLGMYGASPNVKEQFLISSAAHYDLRGVES